LSATNVTDDNSTSVGTEIDAPIDSRISRHALTGHGILVLVVIDPDPGGTGVIRPKNSSDSADYSADEQCWVGIARGLHAEAYDIGFRHSANRGETCAAIGGVE
jgi:hypothetical protein